jgi:glucose-1-phosphate cytidylyltransferase
MTDERGKWPELSDLDAVILAGGFGTRLREETVVRPKPMVEIGGRPILWHIMSIYAAFGIRNFIVCLGFKGDIIRDYFLNYRHRTADVAVDLATNSVEVLDSNRAENWRVVLVETGNGANTGARLKRAVKYLRHATFLATYGDGVADLDVERLYESHKQAGRRATVTAVHPEARFGEINLSGDCVSDFMEKPQTSGGWINGGFFVFDRSVFDEAAADPNLSLEHEVLTALARANDLSAYLHNKFWQCVDTHREMMLLNEKWSQGQAPWLVRYGGKPVD